VIGSVDRRQPGYPGWRLTGHALVRELAFRDFDEAIAFVERVAVAAEDYLRRPDICILQFNRVRLRVANPNHSGITQAELRLAAKVNTVVESRR
jgi:4a-hydroxytetrahydrobiopterin dehydratase